MTRRKIGPKTKKQAEADAKKSATMREKFKDPELQKRHSEAIVKKWKEPEYKAKISAARLLQWAKKKGKLWQRKRNLRDSTMPGIAAARILVLAALRGKGLPLS